MPERILGLPDHLAVVPPSPAGPNDTEADAKRAAWEAWVIDIRRHRLEVWRDCADNPALQKIERRKCALDPAYFLTMYGTIFEPRTNRGRGGYNAWVPFERQVQQIRWWQELMAADDEKADGVLSKCRDVGASWTMCACFVWGWLFTFPFNGLMVSRVEDLVDSHSPKSLFWKIEKLLKMMPAWLLPRGFEWHRHRMHLYLENPENGNTITGESTNSNAARGDRATCILFDEAAMIDHFLDIWMGAADSTEHRVAISTESLDKGPDFYNLFRGTDVDYFPSPFAIDWWEHPRHDQQWYDRQVKRFEADPDAFRREVMRDPRGSSSIVYPAAAEIEVKPLEYVRGNPLFVAIDPGFDDDYAIIWIQYNVTDGYYEVLDAYSDNRKYGYFYGTILTGIAESGEWEYSERDLAIMAWTKNLPRATYIGDAYGDNKLGATADTFYSELRKHGIYVNADRTPTGQVPANKMRMRTHQGRREALRWLMPRLRFNDTLGARQALKAIQQNQYDRSGDKIGERGMKRDWTTHFTSALEYFAAHTKLARDYDLADSARSARAEAEKAQRRANRGHRYGNRRYVGVA